MTDDLLRNAEQLAQFIEHRAPIFVLTGAGISTASGIPDYRDAEGNWKVNPPVQHRSYVDQYSVRQRYWARSLVGWRIIDHATPSQAHQDLFELTKAGLIERIVTQNVDRLHQKAGCTDTIDLHGRADKVICMSCQQLFDRSLMHQWCRQLNPWFNINQGRALPDGDADIEIDFSNFKVPDCPDCKGLLKTDVVYFGDTVPRGRVDDAIKSLKDSQGLLIIGSSLMVYSGFRFNRIAMESGIAQAALTLGRTRADHLLQLKLDAPINETLSKATQLLGNLRTTNN